MTEQTIFLSALDIPDAGKRSAYLETACAGDAGLRKQVEALLAAHERSGLFLDDPAVAQMAGVPPTPGEDTVTADAGPAHGRDDDLRFLNPPTRPGSLGRLAHYEVLEVLGRGGFGTVLRAFDDHLHRMVAIKVLAPQLATSGTARSRFRREAKSGAAVRDEHVVHIYAVADENEPIPYLVMEYIAGQTLQQKIDRTGPLPVHEILRIGSQVARGLAAAHDTGHIHRDIKPSNILLENGVERVKLTDFGLARAADDASISHSGIVAGTPMYMSPEQAQGGQIDHRADLFSLGSVLYAMCTGRPPFRASTTMAVLKRVCEEEPRSIAEINSEVPGWLRDVIAKLHAKRPEDRFQSAKEVGELLQQHLAQLQQPNLVAPPPAVVPVSPSPNRWQVGDRVLAPWEAEWLYPATVLLTNGDSIHVIYDDGDSSWWDASELRPLAIEKGARVFGCWNGPFYPATVTEREGNRIHLEYDDGDSEWTDFSDIRVAAPRPAPAELSAEAARRRRRKWVAAAVGLALLLILAFGAIRYGHAAMLYSANEGELELVPEDGLTTLIVLENPDGVSDPNKVLPTAADWMQMTTKRLLTLPPGKYRLNAGTSRLDTRFIHWRATTTDVFGQSRTYLLPAEGGQGWSTVVTVERGCRVSVFPVVSKDLPRSEPDQDAGPPPRPVGDR
jgi:eukaryotic-like serine/threonine-protein kinase